MHPPVQNIKAHLWTDHNWNVPFGSMTERSLRELHNDMHGKDGNND